MAALLRGSQSWALLPRVRCQRMLQMGCITSKGPSQMPSRVPAVLLLTQASLARQMLSLGLQGQAASWGTRQGEASWVCLVVAGRTLQMELRAGNSSLCLLQSPPLC